MSCCWCVGWPVRWNIHFQAASWPCGALLATSAAVVAQRRSLARPSGRVCDVLGLVASGRRARADCIGADAAGNLWDRPDFACGSFLRRRIRGALSGYRRFGSGTALVDRRHVLVGTF